ncbi:DUF1499 domain-containing protein [Lysobacter sp. A03]|uniref:DUF1499 domain-containing protein n=1 Tax=Lysobacter sp. A03 TaxID=1199154 RepID=UPI0005B6B97D|nr:DUF1499 domain-containing protein [Lysobacter sp. A03]KIQ96402.1 hypothetical protein TI01_2080 [Lysobacter sp. A03]
MRLSRFVLVIALLAALLLLIAGPGTRMDLWDFRTGFGVMRWAAYIGLGAALVAVLLLLAPSFRRAGGTVLAAALVMGLVVAFVPWNAMRGARQVPPIHDISTDTERPPQFVDILPLRADAPNPADYGGAEIARQQLAAYPELGPYTSALPPAQAYENALEAAKKMGWVIVASDPASGRIEASDTTPWFGFTDDVVIRVEAEGDGSRIDVRSVSRVGKSDVGTNAKRIRAYLAALARLG